LRKQEPLVGEQAIITVLLDNAIVEEAFLSVRGDIQQRLRSELGNPDIFLQCEITESQEQERKPFTAKEKFEALLSENPVIKELRDEFDLDID
jgi:DNA polymerase-3 subunit gamma/tau